MENENKEKKTSAELADTEGEPLSTPESGAAKKEAEPVKRLRLVLVVPKTTPG